MILACHKQACTLFTISCIFTFNFRTIGQDSTVVSSYDCISCLLIDLFFLLKTIRILLKMSSWNSCISTKAHVVMRSDCTCLPVLQIYGSNCWLTIFNVKTNMFAYSLLRFIMYFFDRHFRSLIAGCATWRPQDHLPAAYYNLKDHNDHRHTVFSIALLFCQNKCLKSFTDFRTCWLVTSNLAKE